MSAVACMWLASFVPHCGEPQDRRHAPTYHVHEQLNGPRLPAARCRLECHTQSLGTRPQMCPQMPLSRRRPQSSPVRWGTSRTRSRSRDSRYRTPPTLCSEWVPVKQTACLCGSSSCRSVPFSVSFEETLYTCLCTLCRSWSSYVDVMAPAYYFLRSITSTVHVYFENSHLSSLLLATPGTVRSIFRAARGTEAGETGRGKVLSQTISPNT